MMMPSESVKKMRYDVRITNSKQRVPGLPLTGAAGQVLMVVCGSALLLIAGGTALAARSRRRSVAVQ